MLDTIATVVVAVLGIHIIIKFAFFALPYRRRRALLDKQYGDKPSATTTSDRVLMVFTVLVAALLLWRGVQAVSFLGGLWIGATLIQLYFHQFHRPVTPQRAAAPPTSPLKEMSYAIQDAPLASLASVADADRAGRILPRVDMVKGIVVQRV